MAKVSEKKYWEMEKVRRTCVMHRYYTAGDNEAYGKMLMFVAQHKPTTNNIYKVAADIFEHSDIDLNDHGVDKNEMIAAIMFDIHRECVSVHYEIK